MDKYRPTPIKSRTDIGQVIYKQGGLIQYSPMKMNGNTIDDISFF